MYLYNNELHDAARKLRIPNFRGVFMRNTLPDIPRKGECGIFNLGDTNGTGTHWVAWYKRGQNTFYFDSYGIQPPTELVKYALSDIYYNTEKINLIIKLYADIYVYTYCKDNIMISNIL